jgi:Cu(I)/Ag(I) efflux system membrane fusion protein
MDTGPRRIAFVSLGGSRCEPREVTTGRETGNGCIEILEGLRAGESVVSNAHCLLDSESNIREALRKFTNDGLLQIKG